MSNSFTDSTINRLKASCFIIEKNAFDVLSIDKKSQEKLPKTTAYAAKKERYYLGKHYPGIYFTKQEAQCMMYILKGLTDKQIGKILQLSHQTISYYCFRMRYKVPCSSKKALAELVKKTDFMNYIIKNENIYS